MTILAPVEAHILQRIFERAGFRAARTSARAALLVHPKRPAPVTVPRSGDVQEDVVRQKLRAAGLTPTEYMAFFNVLKEEDSSLGR
jgi:predicted RNA binding protein YcfA (HicA-like mRNA interferase family)